MSSEGTDSSQKGVCLGQTDRHLPGLVPLSQYHLCGATRPVAPAAASRSPPLTGEELLQVEEAGAGPSQEDAEENPGEAHGAEQDHDAQGTWGSAHKAEARSLRSSPLHVPLCSPRQGTSPQRA